MGFGDDVLMLHRNDGNPDAHRLSRAAGEIARRRHDMFAGDVALVGDDLPLPARESSDRGHGGMAIDFAATLTSAARQRLGEVCRLDVAILRMLDRADDPVDIAKRPDVLDLLRSEELHLDPADRRGDPGVIAVFVHPIAGASKTDVGNLAQPDVEASLLLERLVKGDGIFVDLPHGVAEIEERQQAGRMPGRAGGELLALDEHAIRPAFLDEMIEGRNSDHAPANHDRPRMRPHRGSLLSLRWESIRRVRHRGLALIDEGADRFVPGGVERRRLVLGEHRFP